MSNETAATIQVDGDQDSATVFQALTELLAGTPLLTLATVGPDGHPHANTCYFAESGVLTLFILTPPSTQHATFAKNTGGATAGTIFKTDHQVGDPISGLQFEGILRPLTLAEADQAFTAYTRKHPTFLEYAASATVVYSTFESRFYELAISKGTLLDEPRFGPENTVMFQPRP